jgi:hypothetical protein
MEFDTTSEAHEIQRAIYRRMSSERRFEIAAQMSDDVRAFTLAGIRSRHPEYDAATARRALLRIVLGDAGVLAAWPDQPLVAP